MPPEPSEKTFARMRKFAEKYAAKTGTSFRLVEGVTDSVILGLANHIDTLGKPLRPDRFYADKEAEVFPITEHLPKGREGFTSYGLVKDPTPNKSRESAHKAEQRELDHKERPS